MTMARPRRAIIVSISSDIGLALADHWLAKGWQVSGTFRTSSPCVDALRRRGVELISCDVADMAQVNRAAEELRRKCPAWDVVVMCPGRLDPVGPFSDCSPDEWEASVRANFLGPMRLLHALLSARRRGDTLEPCVLCFAGAGTNSAPVNYSAYGISKIALIKMCELLDAEVPDTRFVILGPGWVKTKIHEATLRAGTRAGTNLRRTQEQLEGSACTPMERVLACCDWIIESPRAAISGRNISLAFDAWGSDELLRCLEEDPNLYKLRRHGNASLVAAGPGGAR